jgi:DNA-binding NarL/FixJ family response regulator
LDVAAAHSEKALAFLDKAGYAAEMAWAKHEYADTLIRRDASGDRSRAAELNAEAIGLAENLGMKPLLARAQALQADIDAAPAGREAKPAGLGAREIDVIQLVAAGKSNREIAETLIISLNTVTHHMTSIFNKTESANRAEAAAFATRNGLA